MPPDTDARKDAGAGKRPRRARRLSLAAATRALRGAVRSGGRLVEYLAADDRRRRRTSLAGALVVNAGVLSLMAAYGRIHIWIPSTPGDHSLSVVMVELPTRSVLPELAPEPVVEPAPEPVVAPEPEPEVVEQPTPEPEPEPAPMPEPEPEPEPAMELTPDPILASPAEEPDLFAPEVDPGLTEEPGPLTITEQQGPSPEPAPPEDSPLSPADEADPLVDDTGRPEPQSGLEVTERVEEGEAPPETVEQAQADPAPANDDLFDQPVRFGAPPRSVLDLPTVELPQGGEPAAPGTSGVVAIFCPDQFEDREKIAECAGRPEIRSGWRPGASGEDWSRAARLLRQARERGETGDDPALVQGPGVARDLRDRQQQQQMEYGRRGVGVNDPAGAASGNLDAPLGRPDIGPRDFEPTWTLPEDPNVSQRDLRRLERDLEEAERRRNPNN